eukprot:2914678-Rhodomonas_salina.2
MYSNGARGTRPARFPYGDWARAVHVHVWRRIWLRMRDSKRQYGPRRRPSAEWRDVGLKLGQERLSLGLRRLWHRRERLQVSQTPARVKASTNKPKPVPVVPTTQYYALLRLLLPMPVLTWYWAFLPGVHQLVGLIGGADLGCYSWPVPCEWPQFQCVLSAMPVRCTTSCGIAY